MTKPSRRSHAVRLHGLEKSYRRGKTRSLVLNDLAREVTRGECVFLAGPSGSGKTTLLSIIGCILSSDRGEVDVLGQSMNDLNRRRRAAFRLAHIGFVFQRFQLIRGLTALENVCVPLTFAGTKQSSARLRGLALLDSVGLADFANAHPANMSTGQCQRIALARALVTNPDLILADEPTAALDAQNGNQVMRLLRDLTVQQDRTAIVVTHDSRIFPFADRVHWLENGQIVRSQTPREMAAKNERDRTPFTFPPAVIGSYAPGSSVGAFHDP